MIRPMTAILILTTSGLLTAIQLQRFGNLKTLVLEKSSKSTQDAYGRAITLYPRTSELLDQLSLADELAQECFACRDTVSYDAEGREVKGRGWAFMEDMVGKSGTEWGFALVLRQRWQEVIYRRVLSEEGGELLALREVVGVKVWDEEENKVEVRVRDVETGVEEVVRCKYLIGCDGGRSFVRRAMDIPFDGETTEDKRVRIDGIVETDMPKTRVYGALESPTHGNVLWAALDRGATRIGFAYTAERQKGYKEFGEEAAVAEAIASVKPFSLGFKEVHWYTVYSVGQRIARRFFAKDAVFLAGDACHTHSSGAAQGLNTGIHDAVNLSWKLSLVLGGLARPVLLDTYEGERLPNVQKLINYDKDISRLMTMQLPVGWKGDPNADPNEVLGHVMAEAATFTSGLAIAYGINIVNVQGSFVSSLSPAPLSPGQRAPDVKVLKPGTFETTRLHKQTPNNAKFHIIVFAGRPAKLSAVLKELESAIQSSKLGGKLPISWLTLIAETGPSAYELLGGMMPFGRVYYDRSHAAHESYGVDVEHGGIVVLRPDGWVGTMVTLSGAAVSELESYFEKFLYV